MSEQNKRIPYPSDLSETIRNNWATIPTPSKNQCRKCVYSYRKIL